MKARKNDAWPTVLTVAVLLLATGLRYITLNSQSFWNDEGNTARLIERPVNLIIEGAAGDIHPPGYYLLLHLWRTAAGSSEFALRGYSALCGILTVAVATALGRRSGGTLSAIGAGLMVALHPLSVTYSQEARMYAQLGLCTAVTLWAATALVLHSTERAKPSRWSVPTAGLALCVTAGLYTQYTYVLALVGLNVAFGLWWITQPVRPWRLLGQWILAHAVAGLLFLPWAPIALGAIGWRPPDLAQGEATQILIRTLAVGTTFQEAPLTLIMPVAGGLVLLALVSSLKTSRRSPRRFLIWAALSMAILPAALIAGAGLYRPAYLKFLTMSVAPLAVVLAVPLNTTGSADHAPHGRRAHRGATLGAAALLLGGILPYQIKSLGQLYNNPAYRRDDYRGIAALIRAEGRPGDAILLSAPNQWEVFTYYYGSRPGDTLPVYPAPYRATRTEATTWVNDIVTRHAALGHGGRLFVLFWGDIESDPERLIERSLSTQAYKAGDVWITTVRLARYGTFPAEPEPGRSLEAAVGEHIRLAGSELPDSMWEPGDIVPLTLFWETDSMPEERLKVFVHLTDSTGAIVAQVDTEPQTGFAPTVAWQPGEIIEDRYGVLLPADLALGYYTLLVGMYRFSGERLSIAVPGGAFGDALPLYKITVQAPGT